ncbi:MAG: NAD-dependent epimerase/dehydratase family protein [Methanobacteriota archaeon]
MKVFVSGGAGFIGSHLVDRLISRGDEVTVFDNLSSGSLDFIRGHLDEGSVSMIEADLLDLESVTEALLGHDFVYHLAANPDIGYGIEHSDWDLKQNTIVTYNVLEAMRVNGVKSIVFPSTSAVYGEPDVIPTPEDFGPLFPISLYGASKLACEALVSAFCGTYGFCAWVFRFANIVGGRGTHGVSYDFIEKLCKNDRELEILGDGEQKKSYLHVDDLLDGVFHAIEHSDENLNYFNLGCGDQVSVREIAQIVCDEMGLSDVEFKFSKSKRGWPGDVTVMNLAVEKIGKLGWKAKCSSKEAVRRGVAGMLECRL